jgi:archaellum component FlaC
MTNTPAEPTNLVLEQLRLMRAETNSRFDRVEARFNAVDARFNAVDAKIAGIGKELRGLKLNAIAEIYKANLTVASFADHERRIQELERKSS